MSSIDLKCSCGNPDCKQQLSIRKGAVFHGSDEVTHWNQGYINIYGVEGLPEVMLDPEQMVELRDWLNEHYKDS